MIDNIERNILATVDYVESAKTETKQAVTYQKKARRVRLINIIRFYFTPFIVPSFMIYKWSDNLDLETYLAANSLSLSLFY